jgi:hypothetical protein
MPSCILASVNISSSSQAYLYMFFQYITHSNEWGAVKTLRSLNSAALTTSNGDASAVNNEASFKPTSSVDIVKPVQLKDFPIRGAVHILEPWTKHLAGIMTLCRAIQAKLQHSCKNWSSATSFWSYNIMHMSIISSHLTKNTSFIQESAPEVLSQLTCLNPRYVACANRRQHEATIRSSL